MINAVARLQRPGVGDDPLVLAHGLASRRHSRYLRIRPAGPRNPGTMRTRCPGASIPSSTANYRDPGPIMVVEKSGLRYAALRGPWYITVHTTTHLYGNNGHRPKTSFSYLSTPSPDRHHQFHFLWFFGFCAAKRTIAQRRKEKPIQQPSCPSRPSPHYEVEVEVMGQGKVVTSRDVSYSTHCMLLLMLYWYPTDS